MAIHWAFHSGACILSGTPFLHSVWWFLPILWNPGYLLSMCQWLPLMSQTLWWARHSSWTQRESLGFISLWRCLQYLIIPQACSQGYHDTNDFKVLQIFESVSDFRSFLGEKRPHVPIYSWSSGLYLSGYTLDAKRIFELTQGGKCSPLALEHLSLHQYGRGHLFSYSWSKLPAEISKIHSTEILVAEQVFDTGRVRLLSLRRLIKEDLREGMGELVANK